MKTDQLIAADQELVFTRLFNAPRELVFDAWTKPEHLAQWFGPDGFTLTTHSMEVKKNGIWNYTMHGPDGRNYPNKVIYLEILKPEKIVYRHMGEEPGVEPVSFVTTVEFKKEGNKTALTMTMVFNSAEELQRVVKEYGAIEGAKQTLARLDALLSKLS